MTTPAVPSPSDTPSATPSPASSEQSATARYGAPPLPPPAWTGQPHPAQGWGAAPTHPAGTALITAESRQWGMVSHIGTFVAAWIALGILCPIIMIIAKGEDRFVRHHAYESLNFQINGLVWIALSVILMFVGIGFVLIVGVAIWYLVFVIMAGLAANRGEWYRYPLIVRVVNP